MGQDEGNLSSCQKCPSVEGADHTVLSPLKPCLAPIPRVGYRGDSVGAQGVGA